MKTIQPLKTEHSSPDFHTNTFGDYIISAENTSIKQESSATAAIILTLLFWHDKQYAACEKKYSSNAHELVDMFPCRSSCGYQVT